MLINGNEFIAELGARLNKVCHSPAFVNCGAPVPQLFTGLPTTEPACYIATDEMVDTIKPQGVSTIGVYEVEFTANVWAQCTNAKREKVSHALQAYTEAIFAAVLADPTMGGLVERVTPEITMSGIASDSSNRYIGGVAINLTCNVTSSLSQDYIKAVTDESN